MDDEARKKNMFFIMKDDETQDTVRVGDILLSEFPLKTKLSNCLQGVLKRNRSIEKNILEKLSKYNLRSTSGLIDEFQNPTAYILSDKEFQGKLQDIISCLQEVNYSGGIKVVYACIEESFFSQTQQGGLKPKPVKNGVVNSLGNLSFQSLHRSHSLANDLATALDPHHPGGQDHREFIQQLLHYETNQIRRLEGRDHSPTVMALEECGSWSGRLREVVSVLQKMRRQDCIDIIKHHLVKHYFENHSEDYENCLEVDIDNILAKHVYTGKRHDDDNKHHPHHNDDNKRILLRSLSENKKFSPNHSFKFPYELFLSFKDALFRFFNEIILFLKNFYLPIIDNSFCSHACWLIDNAAILLTMFLLINDFIIFTFNFWKSDIPFNLCEHFILIPVCITNYIYPRVTALAGNHLKQKAYEQILADQNIYVSKKKSQQCRIEIDQLIRKERQDAIQIQIALKVAIVFDILLLLINISLWCFQESEMKWCNNDTDLFYLTSIIIFLDFIYKTCVYFRFYSKLSAKNRFYFSEEDWGKAKNELEESLGLRKSKKSFHLLKKRRASLFLSK